MLGAGHPHSDAEVIALACAVLRKFKLLNKVKVKKNNQIKENKQFFFLVGNKYIGRRRKQKTI